jgi:hypothetical protein
MVAQPCLQAGFIDIMLRRHGAAIGVTLIHRQEPVPFWHFPDCSDREAARQGGGSVAAGEQAGKVGKWNSGAETIRERR